MRRLLFATAAIFFIIFLIVIAAITVIFSAKPSYASNSIDILQAGKPTGGWEVCNVYGEGAVPGLPDLRPLFQLCHPGGWQVEVYCLNPELPLPELGAKCNRINDNQYSCGDGIQTLQEIPQQETPTPTSTATPTITQTETSTLTQTSTATITITPTWTSTVSSTPTQTTTSTITPTSSSTPTATTTTSVTPVPTSTATQTNTPTFTSTASVSPIPPTNTLLPTITSPATYTPTATWVIFPTSTSTYLPSATPIYPTATPRQPSGGYGFRDIWTIFLSWLGLLDLNQNGAPPHPTLSTTTPTPFQPLRHPPSAWIGQPGESPPLDFYGIDFSPGAAPVTIQIITSEHHLNQGKPVVIRFRPGAECNFGDGQGCTSVFPGVLGGHTIFVTVHSGIGGEAQSLRHTLEGTGFDQAAYSLEKVHNKMKLLEGAQVTISQGDITASGFTLQAATRIPAGSLQQFFNLPIPQALQLASDLDPSLGTYLPPDQPQIVIETCGWKMPGEPWAPGVTSTSGSAYLGFIRK